MKFKGQKFIEKEKFVPKEEIEGFQYDTLKRVFLGYHIDVPSTETKRSTQSGIFKRGIRLKHVCRVLQRSLVVLMIATTSERLRPIVPTVRRLQCFCDYYCEKFMDCCADYDKYWSTSNSFLPQDTFLNSSCIVPTATVGPDM